MPDRAAAEPIRGGRGVETVVETRLATAALKRPCRLEELQGATPIFEPRLEMLVETIVLLTIIPAFSS